MFLKHPYLDTFATRGNQIAAIDWLPHDFRGWKLVRELLHFDQLLCRERLLWLLSVSSCCRFSESEYFYLVAMSIHSHAAYCNGDIVVALVLEAD